MVQVTTDTSAQSSEQVVTFADNEIATHVEVSETSTVSAITNSALSDAPLAKFLERPVKIATIDWTAAYAGTRLDPWALLLNDSKVKTKLQYFKYFRATLNVRFIVNGTPFHYGRLLVGYEPSVDGNPVMGNSLLNAHRVSQLPHLLIDPTTNDSKELALPYVSPMTYIDLTEATASQVGVLQIIALNPLLMSNTATVAAVDLSVFAWFTDVEMVLPTTATVATFTAQSNSAPSKDEYADSQGPISTIASAVARLSGRLTDLPVIGRFALATHIGAKAASSIASIFGFSRPVQLAPLAFMKPLHYSQMAQTEGTDSVFKLTVDPKQEVTIDNSVCGLTAHDNLNIQMLCSTPSWLVKETWATTDVPGTVLLTLPVNPVRYPINSVTNGSIHYPTALGYFSYPFEFWAGDICYCVQVVCSEYHRGRLRLSYVPDGDTFADDYNNLYSYVIDIANNQNFEVQVGWARNQGFLGVIPKDMSDGYNAAHENGTFVVSVVNALSAPLSTSSVEINFWVKAGPNFELAVPDGESGTHSIGNSTQWAPQSMAAECKDIAVELVPSSDNPARDITYVGETITSFRQLLKRYTPYRAIGYNHSLTVNNGVVYDDSWPHFPRLFGYDPNGWEQTSGLVNFNYVNTGYMQHLMPAFLGVKGSTRYKFYKFMSKEAQDLGYTRVTRYSAVSSDANLLAVTNLDYDGAASKLAYDYKTANALPVAGCNIWPNGGIGGGIEVENPWYSRYRFYPFTTEFASYKSYREQRPWLQSFAGASTSSSNDLSTMTHAYIAAGEDFSLVFFKGAPTFYTMTAVPAPKLT